VLRLNRPLRRLLSSFALVALLAGAVDSVAAGAQDADARSGAALNRDAAVAFDGHATPAEPGAVAAATDPSTLANNPAADAGAQDTQSETTILVDGENVLVGYNDSGSFIGADHFTGWAVSSNGGTTFTDKGALPNSAGGDAGDPVLAVNKTTHRIYFSTLSFTNNLANIQVFRSDTGGQSFMAPVNATPGMPGGSQQDKEWIAVDNFPGACNGNVYLTWRQFGGANEGVQFTRSTDNGNTWTPNAGLDIVTGTSQGAYVAVGPNHEVYVFWLAATNTLRVRKSTDCGQTFGASVLITDILSTGVNGDLGLSGGFRSNAFPHAVIQPTTGAIFVVFNDNPAGADAADTYYVSSTDGGATWSPRTRINADAGTRDNWSPTIGMTSKGKTVMVGWYDRRADGSNIQRYGRIGQVSGGTINFNAEFVMSPQFPVVVGQDPVINTVYMGDYDQIVGTNAFYSSWGDNRDSGAVHAHQPDVRYAIVPAKGAADLSMALTDSPDPVAHNANVTFSATVQNNSLKRAELVYVTVNLPVGMTFVSATAPAGGTCYRTAQMIVCRVGSVNASSSKVVTVVAQATGAGTVATTASVTSPTKDAAQANNADTENTTINP